MSNGKEPLGIRKIAALTYYVHDLARVREFMAREVDPAAIDRDARIPEPVIRGLFDLGVMSMSVPPRMPMSRLMVNPVSRRQSRTSTAVSSA